jgi:hypothetical protein
MEIINSANSAQKYNCTSCHVICSKKNDWDRHLATNKHKRNNIKKIEMVILPKKHTCNCGKIYASNSGLWKHSKTCKMKMVVEEQTNTNENQLLNIIIKENTEFKNLILKVVQTNSALFKQNQEYQKQTHDLQKQVLDACKKIQPTINSQSNNINSHNKTFNLQFFLNEQCKDAMNIMDFVNTFQLQLSDLEHIGEVGYVEGISNIVIDKLNQMDIYKRPIHCSDAKREIMHVKDKDVWEKDTPTNAKIRMALKHITKKNTDLLRPWVNAHPGVLDSEHRLNDKYQQLFIEAMGGNSGTLTECETKIIKKISKMVLIDKHQQTQ